MRSDLEEEILQKIKPSPEQDRQIQRTMLELCETVRRITNARGWSIEPILVGSIAKETHLIEPDIDVFIPFPPTTDREVLKREGLAIGHAVLPEGEEKYAEHPYVSGRFKGFQADVVPCYHVDEPSTLLSAVDRTPFHTEYVKSYLDASLRDDVRLLKQFLKGIEVYGADERVKGFSGYLTELLVIHFNGLRPLIQSASHWRSGQVIILETIAEQVKKHHLPFSENGEEDSPPTAKELRRKLRQRFVNDVLILIDPVDLNRNVASAISRASFARFIHACRCYLKSPKTTFFVPNPQQPEPPLKLLEMLDKRGTKVITVSFQKPGVIDDILYSQLRKAVKRIGKTIGGEGFEVVNAAYFVEKEVGQVHIFIELLFAELPALKPHFGPPVWHRNAEHFLKKWHGDPDKRLGTPYIEDERWRVDIVRKYTRAESVLGDALRSAKLGKYIEEQIRRDHTICTDHAAIAQAFPVFLTRFIARKFPWEY